VLPIRLERFGLGKVCGASAFATQSASVIAVGLIEPSAGDREQRSPIWRGVVNLDQSDDLAGQGKPRFEFARERRRDVQDAMLG
jgi:hypothetical protein